MAGVASSEIAAPPSLTDKSKVVSFESSETSMASSTVPSAKPLLTAQTPVDAADSGIGPSASEAGPSRTPAPPSERERELQSKLDKALNKLKRERSPERGGEDLEEALENDRITGDSRHRGSIFT